MIHHGKSKPQRSATTGSCIHPLAWRELCSRSLVRAGARLELAKPRSQSSQGGLGDAVHAGQPWPQSAGQGREGIWGGGMNEMSIDRWMDKEDVHVYSGIVLSHKKKWNWVIRRDVDGPRVCHTEWVKSEREKQISYINAYGWNLEKWYRWTYLQGRNRKADVENGRVDTVGKGRVGWIGRLGLT